MSLKIFHRRPPFRPFSWMIPVCLILISACTVHKASTITTDRLSLSAILERSDRQDLVKKDVKGSARIKVQSPDGSYSSACAVMLRYPDAIRVETIPPFGPPNLFLAINGAALNIYLPGKGEFYTGSANVTNISRFLPFPLDAQELIPILLGVLPQNFFPSGAFLETDEDNGLYRINALFNGKPIRSCWIDPLSGDLQKIEFLGLDGKTLYSAKITNHKRIDGVSLPQHVEFRFVAPGKADLFLSVNYSELKVFSGEDGNSVYDLELPPGIMPIPLD